MRRFAPLVFFALAFAPLSATAQTDCTTGGQNKFVGDVMNHWYYWYREMPSVDPATFPSPESLLEALKFRPLDTSFSYISGRAADQAFYSDSQFIGLGLSYRLDPDGALRVTQAYPNSPASEGGLDRGQELLAIGGVDVQTLLSTGQLGAAFGPSEIGVTVTIRFRQADGVERESTMVKRLVDIPTVSHTRVLDAGGRRVGYFMFRNFVQPSFGALSQAFTDLLTAGGVDDLVIDLRYNGGGLVSVAQHLGGLVGARRTEGQIFAQFVHNDKNSTRNVAIDFPAALLDLGLQRLIVITTPSSASASELLINALRPFVPVVIVGNNTYGKPVGQYSFNFCDKVLHPVAFSLQNALGQGDFFGGFAPDCAAADDVAHAIGDPAEASLAEALHYAANGRCSVSSASLGAVRAASRAAGMREVRLPADPFRELVGAW